MQAASPGLPPSGLAASGLATSGLAASGLTAPWATRNGSSHERRRNGTRPQLDPYAALVNRMPPAGAKKVTNSLTHFSLPSTSQDVMFLLSISQKQS